MKVQDFDFSIDVLQALLWRHNEAVNLQALIQNKQTALNELNETFLDEWIKDVFNLNTANDFGLSVWSIILNTPITIGPAPIEPPGSNWGFGEFRKNFNNGNFTDSDAATVFSVQESRIILKLRYYQLVTRATVTEINAIMADVFKDLGTVYVLDGLDMTITYIFDFTPSDKLRLIISDFDLLPRPSAVKLRSIVYQPNSAFGFGSFRKNFNNGNFREFL